MHPALSVIFLTTLIGIGQGILFAMFITEWMSLHHFAGAASRSFYLHGNVTSLAFLGAGLLASFFHLGNPQRAWRSASQWRTSWLSREVILLPALMAATVVYGLAHYFHLKQQIFFIPVTLIIGGICATLSLLLFVCTGMIYACIRFLQEWATPLTVINYLLLGSFSGYLFAALIATHVEPYWTQKLILISLGLLAAAFVTRSASLIRNARLKPKSNLQTAIGIRHNRITQRSQGLMGGSFNTREFFHHAPVWLMRNMKWIFMLLAFLVPGLMLVYALSNPGSTVLATAFLVMYMGLLCERWYFFAQANHPQNLYYQTIG